MAGRDLFGLTPQAKARLLEKVSVAAAKRATVPIGDRIGSHVADDAGRLDAAGLQGSKEIRMIREAAEFLGIADPFFRMHDGIAGAETSIDGKRYINFASYNYLGLNGHPENCGGGEGGDRPLGHLSLGEPPGFGRTADPS